MTQTERKSKITIVTHSGQFHADDVFAVATLSLIFEDKNEIEIVRTRDMEIIGKADFVVDVGGIYDPIKNLFDHHQEGGSGVRENGVPYASIGLVWLKYGELLCGEKEVADEIERKLIWPIDARDNGIDTTINAYPGVFPYELRDLIRAFRVTWKEDSDDQNNHFNSVLNIAKEILKREIKHSKDNIEAKAILKDIYSSTTDKRLLILDKYLPYQISMSDMDKVLLVIYPDFHSPNWCIEGISEKPFSYKVRLDFPENWAGKKNEDLENQTGVPGSIFCHNRRFLAVASNKETAIKLAHLALKEANKSGIYPGQAIEP